MKRVERLTGYIKLITPYAERVPQQEKAHRLSEEVGELNLYFTCKLGTPKTRDQRRLLLRLRCLAGPQRWTITRIRSTGSSAINRAIKTLGGFREERLNPSGIKPLPLPEVEAESPACVLSVFMAAPPSRLVDVYPHTSQTPFSTSAPVSS